MAIRPLTDPHAKRAYPDEFTASVKPNQGHHSMVFTVMGLTPGNGCLHWLLVVTYLSINPCAETKGKGRALIDNHEYIYFQLTSL